MGAQGTEDTIVPYNEAHKIKKCIPQAELVSIEGGSHFMPLEDGQWQQIADALIDFLS